MQYKRMALLALASSMTLAGCGSPTSPVANSPLQQPAAIAQPASEVKAQPTQAANPAAPAAAQTSGNTAAPATNTDFEVKGGMGYAGNDFIVFASDRGKHKDFNEGKNDIYVFDPVLDTVLAIVGVNTDANEFNPRISDNGKWLVFQRTVDSKKYDDKKHQDILMYSMGLKLVNTLPMLNTEEYDEYMPDVTDDGCFIVYVTEIEKRYPELRLYDVKTGDNWAVPGANRNFGDITWPTISANGKRIAYGASTDKRDGEKAEDYLGKKTGGGAFTGDPLKFGESNIFVYDIVSGTQLTPPFLNTAFDEYNPELCGDGSRRSRGHEGLSNEEDHCRCGVRRDAWRQRLHDNREGQRDPGRGAREPDRVLVGAALAALHRVGAVAL